MANVYVRSGAAGAGTGADWANAYTTLNAATTAKAAGDDFWVAEDHAETAGAAKVPVFPGTAANPNRCICVNHSGSVPPVAADVTTGASLTTTGNFAITIGGTVYCYGLTLNCGTGSSSTAKISLATTAGNFQIFEACAFNIVSTSTSSTITPCSSAQATTILVNCTVSFGATGQSIIPIGSCAIRGKSSGVFVTGATIPTTLITSSGAINGGVWRLSCVDLSASGAGKTLVGDGQADPIALVNCKLNASVTVAAVPSDNSRGGCDLIGCNSTTNVERNERYRYQGTLTTETTIIRTAGASDGTTAYSWKIVTTANSKRTFPFETFEREVWGDTTGSSKTLTIHTVTDNVTLKDDEIWVEVEYLGSSATPVATLITDAAATVLTTGANQDSDSGEAWTTTGLGTPVKQALAVTFTPQMKGPIRWRVKVAKASTTVYVCPKADIA